MSDAPSTDFCLNGWGPTERYPSCNYTGGHYCEREDGHAGRCRCVCGSQSQRAGVLNVRGET